MQALNMIDGHHFKTSEHAIQHTKVIMFEDIQTVERILASEVKKKQNNLAEK